MKNSISKVLPVALSVLVLVSVVGYVALFSTNSTKSLSKEEAGESLVSFLGKDLPEGVNIVLGEVIEENGVYKVNFTVTDGSEKAAEPYVFYVTKDAKMFFPQGVNLIEEDSAENVSEDISKTDKPTVDLYVMSFCPYGNKAEDTMLPVYNLLKDKVNWNIHYIVSKNGESISSLHGQIEVDQNEREVCVLQNSGMDAWWKFTTYVNTNCGNDGSCWEDAAQVAGVDSSSIASCVSSDGLALMIQEAEISTQAGASGSPTLIINGTKSNSVYQYGKSQSYLDAICSAFNSSPSECLEELVSTGDTSVSGSCE